MDYNEIIEQRRSIRKYKEKEVSMDTVKIILNAGRLAPTGGNMQPWEFIVAKEKENIEKIVGTTFIGANKSSNQCQLWMIKAPVLIVVCADFTRTVAKYGEMGRDIALMDVAAAIENMLISITALGLGSCWVSGFDRNALSNVMKLPESIQPIAMLPVGYAENAPTMPHKFSLEEIVHYEQYGNSQP